MSSESGLATGRRAENDDQVMRRFLLHDDRKGNGLSSANY
jgi:hypothetical protein